MFKRTQNHAREHQHRKQHGSADNGAHFGTHGFQMHSPWTSTPRRACRAARFLCFTSLAVSAIIFLSHSPSTSGRGLNMAGNTVSREYKGQTSEGRKARCWSRGFGSGDETQQGQRGKSARKLRRKKGDIGRKGHQEISMERARDKAKEIVKNIEAKDDGNDDFFWKIIPALLDSQFRREDIQRVHEFVEISSGRRELPDEILNDPRRPHNNLHAYFPGIEAPSPFRDPSFFPFIENILGNITEIQKEYRALVEADVVGAQFRSVTNINYKNGWKTLPLYYNGRKIAGFPYDLCPVTSGILDQVPVAGRIAGFNRQTGQSGIPLHTDGNNMWLTAQIGIDVPSEGNGEAWIKVGDERHVYKNGEPVVYDTTFPHETFNDAQSDRVVFHIDFWNFLQLTPTELSALEKIYEYRQKYLEAEGMPQSL